MGGAANLPDFGSLRLPVSAPDGPITVGIRPEQVEIGEGGEATARGTVTLVEYLGSEIFLYVRLPSGQMILVEAAGKASHKIGENLPLLIASDNVHVFDAKGQRVSAVREGVLS